MGLHKPIELENLVIFKPDLQPGLTDVIPPGEIPSHYINRYQAEYKVRCAFCDSHMPHNRGFTVRMEDGRTALCGKDCATKYFGKQIADNHEKELEKQIRRATKRKIIQRTLEGVPAALVLLSDDWIEMEERALEASHALHIEFRYSGIQSEISEQGRYELKESRRRWIERDDEFGRTRRVPIDEERIILSISGAAILRGGEMRPPVRLRRVKENLEKLLGVNTERELSDLVVERMSETRSHLFSDIRNAARFLDLCTQFYTKENIKALSRLTKHVKSTAGKIALHKRPYGFDLIITPIDYSGEDEIFNLGREQETYPLPDFTAKPQVEALLAELKDEYV